MGLVMTKCFPKDYMKLHNPVYWWEITVVDLSNDKHLRRTLTRTQIWTRDTEILNKWGWDTGKICLYGYFFVIHMNILDRNNQNLFFIWLKFLYSYISACVQVETRVSPTWLMFLKLNILIRHATHDRIRAWGSGKLFSVAVKTVTFKSF